MPRIDHRGAAACNDCRFFMSPDGNTGECRAHAPLPVQGMAFALGGNAWPRVGADDWCGEFAAAGSAGNTPVCEVLPVISGNMASPSPLHCDQGTWSNAYSFTYQWLSGGSAIAGATSDYYMSATSDVGFLLTCTVTGTNETGSTSATSNGFGPIT